MFLKYKNNGISMPFTIEESIIKESLRNKNYTTKQIMDIIKGVGNYDV